MTAIEYKLSSFLCIHRNVWRAKECQPCTDYAADAPLTAVFRSIPNVSRSTFRTNLFRGYPHRSWSESLRYVSNCYVIVSWSMDTNTWPQITFNSLGPSLSEEAYSPLLFIIFNYLLIKSTNCTFQLFNQRQGQGSRIQDSSGRKQVEDSSVGEKKGSRIQWVNVLLTFCHK